MSFAGDLKKLPLGDVFQSIHQNGLTGALAVRDAKGGERLVAFEEGFVTGCSELEGDERDIADELVRQQVISEKDVARAQSRFFKRKGKLKRSLTSRRLLDSGEFNRFARGIVLERVYDCFLVEEGTFEFLENFDTERFSEDESQASVRVSASEILMEAMRRCDEWQRIRRAIPSFREVYTATRAIEDEDDKLTRELLSLTEGGERPLEEVLATVPSPRFSVCERVLALVEGGSLRVATAPEYTALGKKAEQRGDLSAAANFYERGLHYERGNTELSERRISVLERLSRNDEASAARKVLAGTFLEAGQSQAAERQFAEAARLSSSDPLPRERLLDLQLKRGATDLDPARETARELVALYLSLGLGDKAKGVYPRLLTLAPKDVALRERQAEVHEELNEQGTAGQLRRELANEALKRKDPDAALIQLRKVAALLPDDQRAQALLEEVETGEYQASKRRRRLRLGLALGVAVLGVGVSWGVFEVMALAGLRRAQRDALPLLHSGCEGALAALEVIDLAGQPYPRTRAAAWGEENVLQLSEFYTEAALRSGERARLRSQVAQLSRMDVLTSLTSALDPREGASFKAELTRACELLDRDQRAEAKAVLTPLRLRLLSALEALHRADSATRSDTAYEIDRDRVGEALPRFWLAWGEVHFKLGEARERLRTARRALDRPAPSASPAASPPPAASATPRATPTATARPRPSATPKASPSSTRQGR